MAFDPMGTTALVTGASSGFGAEFARRLAQRGADLVLVARREERLEALAAELLTRYGTRSTVVALDLTERDATAELVARLDSGGIRISTLVNNAGFGTYEPVAAIEPDRVMREVDLNVRALVELTRAFLPDLVESGSGALVNVASTAGFQPIPYMAVYGATKAFVLSFTEALWYETRDSGLRVIALCPGPADTEFADIAHNEQMMFGTHQDAHQVVETAMRALDKRRSKPVVVSGRMNAIQARLVGLAPRQLVLSVVGRGGRPKE